mmetsp:Transcript_13995/g.45328  ORF Transcript_13995/g.45328 Transcript_13995/m.45328 type:complete len:216 (-) Transcript_13995:98-745(-)
MVLVGVATCSVPPIPSLSGRDDRGSSELSSLLHRGGRGDYTGKGNTRTLVYAFSKHWFTTPSRLSFSSAAATLSLSLSCLLIASSEACAPGEMRMSTLRRGGSERSSLTRKQRPMSVAMEQCGIVGVKRTTTRPPSSSTSMSRRCATLSCSSVCGCSGSLIPRISSKISSESIRSRAFGSASVAHSFADLCSSLSAWSSGDAFSPSCIRGTLHTR